MKVVQYHCENTGDLANDIVAKANAAYPDHQAIVGRIDWGRFPNGGSNIRFRLPDRYRQYKAAFLVDFSKEENGVRLLHALHWLPKLGFQSVQVIMPFFMCGTMERSARKGDVLTAQTLASMLSGMPITRSGPVELVTYDIHALSETGFFHGIVVTNKSGIKYLRREVEEKLGRKPSYWFPDDGAAKRFKHYFKGHKLGTCEKARESTGVEVEIHKGNPAGQEIIIVDDMTRSAGTLVECAKALRRGHAKSVSIYVTHLDLIDEGRKRLLGGNFDNIFFTDSCPVQAKAAMQFPGAHLISLNESIARTIVEEDDDGDVGDDD